MASDSRLRRPVRRRSRRRSTTRDAVQRPGAGGTESYVGWHPGRHAEAVPPDPAKPGEPGHGTDSPYDPGILLYTTDTSSRSPAVVTHTTDKLELRAATAACRRELEHLRARGLPGQASFQARRFAAYRRRHQSTVSASRRHVLGQFAQLTTDR